ncbi:DUF1772 domain-containing protein [Bradyrhizobium sp. SEMIA]|uniref:DUF1772 domain-containing protein n=1 Tax=Bradyrhizobium sp. SEMIA TaxID=2597515 RepID=UPI0018A48DD8|nr:DUF1772 domain-containing protein [Bradyrhizobium sp. SEMIA]QOG23352.1 DUF1772 domain-containing protein [Bradyrhizobium sp. SEMIA]
MRPGLYAFAVAAAFLGATLYIGVVEQPARLKLGGRAMLKEWTFSFRRGTLTLSVLAVASAVLASIQFRLDGDVRWIIGGITILASWPYAYFVMMPMNIWLCAMSPGQAISPVRKLMRDWGLLEWGLTLIGFAACCSFAWVLELPAH